MKSSKVNLLEIALRGAYKALHCVTSGNVLKSLLYIEVEVFIVKSV